ncbi:DNA-binding transcriptional repressor [Vibrio anguillarum]|uniref:DNA-binding transcriptional repressor n=1 Tax=Vibrio anguillarum TaxID=55601 RepID=A0A191WA22_VIBAN|nr:MULTISPECIES: DNA-binding transcriptional repressor [Vibrio]OXX66615.1 transcriptional regulator [Vibrio sp. V03_P4A6T147]AEH35189.1 Glucitol operon repressor [Vibrio anguillarum 775]AGU59709.1 transcriptional regulator [Vibrio anguillarum M3]ASF93564.1 transcriptional regulator [Vibrio anguillarum]ASG01480.1 transcriptional regulator [Vibrio anguillarum]
MNLDNRRAQLLDYLRVNGKTSVNDLADTFETSGATIRSDLRSLEEEGLVIRRYGAAEACIANSVILEDRSMDEKQTVNLERKCLIAKAASQLVKDGDSIILDCGSTTLQMVPHFEQVMSLTLMTNSIHIVNAVANLDAEHTVLVPGGTYRRKSASFHGTLAEQAFKQFSFDKLFIGADGFDLAQGTTTYNEAYQVSQAMCQAANQIIVVTDSSKFGRRSPNVVVPLDKIDIVVTDNLIAAEDRTYLEEKGIQVITVGS